MKATDAAVFGTLDTDRQSAAAGSLGTLGLTGVHRHKAPGGTATPYAVFFTQADVDAYTLSQRAFQDIPYFVDVIDEGLSARRAQDLQTRIDALLTDQAITVAGFGLMYLRRGSSLERDEETDGVTYQHVGAQYRFLVQPS